MAKDFCNLQDVLFLQICNQTSPKMPIPSAMRSMQQYCICLALSASESAWRIQSGTLEILAMYLAHEAPSRTVETTSIHHSLITSDIIFFGRSTLLCKEGVYIFSCIQQHIHDTVAFLPLGKHGLHFLKHDLRVGSDFTHPRRKISKARRFHKSNTLKRKPIVLTQ